MSALTEVWYSGTSLSEIWYGSEKVWPCDGSGGTSGDTSGSYLLRYTTDSGTTCTIPCSSGSTATNLMMYASMMENGVEYSAVTSADFGDCCEVVGNSIFDNVVVNRHFGLTSITVSDTVIEIEHDAFSTCPNLVQVRLPSGLTEISDYLFENDYELTSVQIPNGVTSIGIEAFLNCFSLLDITIPSSVTVIKDSAFKIIRATEYSDENVQKYFDDKIAILNTNRKITFLSEVPPSLETPNGVFNFDNGDNMSYKLYVPSESVDAYKEAWYLYADRIVPITNT